MKTIIPHCRIALMLMLALSFTLSTNLIAQDGPPPIYFEFTKVKSNGEDFHKVTEEIIKPYVKERMKQGTLLAWGLFRVLYPASETSDYNYVIMDVYGSFDHIHMGSEKGMAVATKVFPDADIKALGKRFDDSFESVGSQVFRLLDDAVPGPPDPNNPPKIMRVNHMQVAQGDGGKYVQMEREVFKPLHQERIKHGIMSDWLLCERIMPYGSEWDNDFITMDAFASWGDMAAAEPDGLWKKVHGDKDPEAAWEKIAKLRDLRRAEIWERVELIMGNEGNPIEPVSAVEYKSLKEGTGYAPTIEKEVAFHATVYNENGEKIITSKDMGFVWYHTIKGNANDMVFEKALMKTKPGGIVQVNIPRSEMDAGFRNMVGKGNGVIKIELVSFDDPKPDGAEHLGKLISDKGIDAAMAEYKKLKKNNPQGYVFREGQINGLGYMLLEKKSIDAAIEIFKLNTELYPKSWNVYDSLGDGYLARGDQKSARKNFEKALKINPDFEESRNKLAEM